MINGNEYAWEDLQIVMEGKAQPLQGVAEIEYTTKKEHSNIYGKGDDPVAMGRGKREYSGKIVLLQSEFEALQRSMPGGSDVTKKVPFAITVAYAPEGGVETTDELLYCRINEVKKGMKTGDGNQLIELPLTIGKINYNI